jgi:carbamoyl-phosphate synthase large subunit
VTPMRIAVTPADSSAGINVLRSLRLATGVHVIGLLRRRHAVAERFSDATVLASSPTARLAWIRDACG